MLTMVIYVIASFLVTGIASYYESKLISSMTYREAIAEDLISLPCWPGSYGRSVLNKALSFSRLVEIEVVSCRLPHQ